MKFDTRYNLIQACVVFVGAVKKTADSVMHYATPLFSAYDLNQLQKDEMQISILIGACITRMVHEGRSDFSSDVKLLELTARFDEIERELAECEDRKKRFKNPFIARKISCDNR